MKQAAGDITDSRGLQHEGAAQQENEGGEQVAEDAQAPANGDDASPVDGEDEGVRRYIEAIQARVGAPPRLQPDEEAARLATQVEGTERDEGLESVLAKGTPGSTASIAELEPAFVDGARRYGHRHHITYEAWLTTGVDPAVLARAGITRAPGPTV